MRIVTLSFVLASLGAWGDNLLLNPGFEDLDARGNPAGWSVFVMPLEGATGEVSAEAAEGVQAVVLRTEAPYDEDPANNWSQVIFGDLEDTEFLVRGTIRTEGAGEAAIWLQCFSRERVRLLAAQTTTSTARLSGTNAWTAVSMRLYAPKGTDFMMLRCVLRGTGAAWFDSIEVREAPPEEDDATPKLRPAQFDLHEPLEQDILAENILQVSRAMQETVRSMEKRNTELLDRILSVQEELNAYRTELRESQNTALEPLESGRSKHPLVPHGFVAEGVN